LTAAPATEPVTLAEAKKQVEVAAAITYHDSHLERLIKAATQQALVRSQRQLHFASYRLTIDRFPSCAGTISLPLPPCRSVESIKYYDLEGKQQTLSTDVYRLLKDREPAEICLRYGQVWPYTYNEPDVVEIDYTCGIRSGATNSSSSSSSSPGPSDDPPDTEGSFELIRHGILLLVQAFWQRDQGQPYEALVKAADSIFEMHRPGDDFLPYGEE
jgi:uncharacterized phiE125 gp8 family phage protein